MLKSERLDQAIPRSTADSGQLEIRKFAPADFKQYAEYHLNGEVYRYLYQPAPSLAELKAKFAAVMDPTFSADGDAAHLAVVHVEDNALVGEVILKLNNVAALQGEVGYIFNPRFSGRGYATEAVRCAVDIGFKFIGFHRIFARLDPRNRGSIGVVERLKFRREAHLIQNDFFNGVWGDEYIYAILAEEWRSRRAEQYD